MVSITEVLHNIPTFFLFMITGFNSQTWPRIDLAKNHRNPRRICHASHDALEGRTSRGHACHEESKTGYGVEGLFIKYINYE